MLHRIDRSRFAAGLAAFLALAHLLGPCMLQCDDPSASALGSLRSLLPAAAPSEPSCCAHADEPVSDDCSHEGRCAQGCPGRAPIVTDAPTTGASAVAAGESFAHFAAAWSASAPAATAVEFVPPAGGSSPPVPRAVPALLAASVLLI